MQKEITRDKKVFHSLYWRISAAFLVLLAMVGLAYVYITVRSSGAYFEQVNQRLNRNTASDIAAHSAPLAGGKVNEQAMAEMFHNIMAINPSLEVYLLDPEGRILSYYAPVRKIVLDRVDMSPVREFISGKGTRLIRGDDPRHEGVRKVFSAAPVLAGGRVAGYIYVVLAGEEYDSVLNYLRYNYMFQVGSRAMLATLIFALLTGLLLIGFITRNLRSIIAVMQKFRQGDLDARISVRASGEAGELAGMFNEMADILTGNIEKLKEVEVLRRELLANISHDLRTPISIIHGYAETLQIKEGTISDEDRSRYVAIIYTSVGKLQQLVNELFELSKLDANQVQPVKEPFFLSELVSDVSSKYHLMAREKNISLETELIKEMQPVVADLYLIERVLQNLIDNALKFTPAGGSIRIETNRGDRGIEVLVRDTGIGIAENEKDYVFERYYKGRNSSRHQKNTGLGLAIAKKILDLHGVRLKLQSQLNEGSCFAFELPFYQ